MTSSCAVKTPHSVFNSKTLGCECDIGYEKNSNGECVLCKNAYYKDYIGDGNCKFCPDLSKQDTGSLKGSKSVHHCQCAKKYYSKSILFPNVTSAINSTCELCNINLYINFI